MIERQLKIVERDRQPYPRDVMRGVDSADPFFTRRMVQNQDELKHFVYLQTDIFVNLFSEYQKKEKECDMVFLDIDDRESLHRAYAKFNIVIDKLRKIGVEHFVTMFSGSKGFHIYIPFKPTRIADYRESVKAWLEDNDIWQFIDERSVRENGVVRLPFTKNSKSGMLCVPIYRDDDFASVMSRARSEMKPAEFEWVGNGGLAEILKHYDGMVHRKKIDQGHIVEGGQTVLFKERKHYPPCMSRLIQMAEEGADLNHSERLNMGIFLLHTNGGDVDKAKRLYKKMSDYKESVTTYHLRYAKDRQLNIHGCDALDDLGICCVPPDQCPFYPSINVFMRKDRSLMVEKR